MSRPDDESHTDSAWRMIVENYGERARLDDDAVPEPEVEDPAPPAYDASPDEPEDDEPEDEIAEVDRFQPPEPPPVELPTTWERRAAWGGVFVAPVLAMLLALLQVHVHPLLGWALVGWFVGGFGYLVATMPRTPREPWDDGSRV